MSRGIFNVSKSFQFSSDNPSCPKCPSEVICDSPMIVALPNYWGYQDERGYIKMLRCPDQYCCQSSHDCKGISSCNTGRGGTLCGSCIDDTTESLFVANCYPTDKCYTLLFGFLYTGCVFIYAIFLGILDEVKKELVKKASILIMKIKHKLKSGNTSTINNGIGTETIDIIAVKGCEQLRLIDALLLDNCSDEPRNVPTLPKETDGEDITFTSKYKYSKLVDALLLNKYPYKRKKKNTG